MTSGDILDGFPLEFHLARTKRLHEAWKAWLACPKVGDLLVSQINATRWKHGEHVLVLKVTIIDDESCSFPIDVFHLGLNVRLPIIWDSTAPSVWTCLRAE